MRWLRIGFLLVLCFSPLLGSGSALLAQPPKPPAEVESLLLRLERGDDRTADINALSKRDDSAPYLRLALAGADGRYKRDLVAALQPIEARAWERNKRRFAWWALTRRFDLCAELIVSAPTDKEATDLVGLVTPELNAMGAEAEKALAIGPNAPGALRLVSHTVRTRNSLHFSGDEVTISQATFTDCAIIRADRCEMAATGANVPFLAVRSRLSYSKGVWGEWYGGIVLVNSDMPVRTATQAIILCDGDLTLDIAGGARHCLIIANGSIRSINGRCATKSFVAASGNIDGHGENIFHAGGQVDLWAKVPVGHVRKNQKELPFGVRFFDPKELGLDAVGAFKAGAVVNRVAAGSAFASHDIRAGDLITHVEGTRVNGPAELRRQLRVGFVRGSTVLRLVRGGKATARVVFLDDIPLPEAPMPREVKAK